jgi:hypothetical protein
VQEDVLWKRAPGRESPRMQRFFDNGGMLLDIVGSGQVVRPSVRHSLNLWWAAYDVLAAREPALNSEPSSL